MTKRLSKAAKKRLNELCEEFGPGIAFNPVQLLAEVDKETWVYSPKYGFHREDDPAKEELADYARKMLAEEQGRQEAQQ